ncbi:MAG: DUF6164 family protein [Methylococcales bacterium]|jgi:hypothetical protein|nr:hypothetical protein [Methylococcaceae bacterium]HIL39044.1 hypothetical protein [Methylococcales bacterium]
MTILLFKLNNVTLDEAEDIREILDEQHIDYYETSAGRWGIGVAAIWLVNNQDFNSASTLIHTYQIDRGLQIRREHADLKNQNKLESIFDRLKHRPLLFLLTLVMIGLITALSLKPFFSLINL